MNELERTIKRLLDRVPLVPVVIETISGVRFIIDMPEQAHFSHPHKLHILRRGQPEVAVEYSQIAKVMTVAELPHEPGGMSYSEYYEAMRANLRAAPFRPFLIEFRSGQSLLVESPTITLAGRFASYTPPAPATGIVRFTYDTVARVTVADAVAVQ